ncbi:MAG TPA: hypothetical protein DCE41_12560 [Cytophagales bacterium]|nr:hypothetical protein [Cytophagales bacterium]HAA24340.1 hypothetical protein [Cytophagales bacterium]HAP62875.1 hypothetical protein [Cytophagales bacterium]
MKKLLKNTTFSLVIFGALALIYACTPEVEPAAVQVGLQIEADVVTTGEELDELLTEAGLNPAELSLQEKMDFLSDYLAENFFSGDALSISEENDQITCIAQVFDAASNTYFTDGAAGNSSQVVNAAITATVTKSGTFAGANANIYRNGVNERGNITSTNPSASSCSQVEGRSIATFRPGTQTTKVTFGCEDSDPGSINCDGDNNVCGVYEGPSQNFSDLVERNKFQVEWDDTAISSSTVTIRLRRVSNNAIVRTTTNVLNDGWFNENGLNFPSVSSNTSHYVEVIGGGVTLRSINFTVEND